MSDAADPLVMPPPKGIPFAAQAAIFSIGAALQTAGRLFPERAGEWCWRTYFSPRRTPLPSRERAILASATPLTVPYEALGMTPFPGGALSAWSWGEGPIVLLSHGWESRGAWLATSYVEPLVARGFRVVTLDMPGHGSSPGKMSDVVHFAEALRATAAVVGTPHAIIGHSLGAAGALLALERGLTVSRVVTLAPAVWMLAFPARFCATFNVPASVSDAMYQRLFEKLSKDAWIAGSMDRTAAKIDVPGLIVSDQDDTELHPQGARAVAAAWRGARLIETQGLGHWKVAWAPEIVPQVVDFVAGQGA